MASGGVPFPGVTATTPPVFGFRTPFGDVFNNNLAHYQGTRCEQFELNFYRCCEAFGLVASKRMCDLEYRDLYECAFHGKQKARYMLMKNERMKQWLDGKRDRPYTTNPPALAEARPDFYHHNDEAPFNINA